MDGLGRKLFHVVGGLALVAVYHLFGRDQALPAYGVLFLFVLSAETLRLRVPALNRFIQRRFRTFLRDREYNAPTGTAWYVLGAGLAFLLFAPPIATTAICFLVFGDVTAATVGQRYGKTKIGTKSLEGSLAFVLACLITGGALRALGLDTAWSVLLVGAIVAAAVEYLPPGINDNLAIPLVSGAVMEVVARFAV